MSDAREELWGDGGLFDRIWHLVEGANYEALQWSNRAERAEAELWQLRQSHDMALADNEIMQQMIARVRELGALRARQAFLSFAEVLRALDGAE